MILTRKQQQEIADCLRHAARAREIDANSCWNTAQRVHLRTIASEQRALAFAIELSPGVEVRDPA
jgi:hypothetical protein